MGIIPQRYAVVYPACPRPVLTPSQTSGSLFARDCSGLALLPA